MPKQRKSRRSRRENRAIHAKKRRKMIEKNIDGSPAKGFYQGNESLL